MTNIKYLPKFYSKEEKKAKIEEMRQAIRELLATNKLTNKEIENLKDWNAELPYLADTYSRNYVIRRINELSMMTQRR